MSNTFNGRLPEFPEIQVDYFRKLEAYPTPLASFLSHVHSDHLEGLENQYQGPFIYCSESTKNLFLKLQTKAQAQAQVQAVEDIVSCTPTHARTLTQTRTRTVQKYKYSHISPKLLKPLSMNYAHKLRFGTKTIQVTLIDANHCLGSVMFLFQNENNQAVLYTGDLRAEPWFLNSLIRNPCLVPFLAGKTKRLECIYADTTFAYRKEGRIEIPSNMTGIRNLLSCMDNYLPTTIFFFTCMTLGYEEAILWVASRYNCKVHVDEYSYSLLETCAEYDNTSRTLLSYLTTDPYAARFHNCKKSSKCPIRERSDIVFLSPTICYNPEEVEYISRALDADIFEAERLPIQLQQHNTPYTQTGSTADITTQVIPKDQQSIYIYADHRYIRGKDVAKLLPTKLMFNFSRHSSYSEIKQFIALFRPKSVYPCVAPIEACKRLSFRMHNLFADVCSSDCQFRFDKEMSSTFGPKASHTLSSIQIYGTRPVKSTQKHLRERPLSISEQDNPDSQSSDSPDPGTTTLILELINNTSADDKEPKKTAGIKNKRKHTARLIRSNKPLNRNIAFGNLIRACRINDTLQLLMKNQSSPWFDLHLDCLAPKVYKKPRQLP